MPFFTRKVVNCKENFSSFLKTLKKILIHKSSCLLLGESEVSAYSALDNMCLLLVHIHIVSHRWKFEVFKQEVEIKNFRRIRLPQVKLLKFIFLKCAKTLHIMVLLGLKLWILLTEEEKSISRLRIMSKKCSVKYASWFFIR